MIDGMERGIGFFRRFVGNRHAQANKKIQIMVCVLS